VSGARAAFVENKDQNIQVQAASTALAAEEVEEEAFAELNALQAEQQNHLPELPHHQEKGVRGLVRKPISFLNGLNGV
jgi:hypothetical protein